MKLEVNDYKKEIHRRIKDIETSFTVQCSEIAQEYISFATMEHYLEQNKFNRLLDLVYETIQAIKDRTDDLDECIEENLCNDDVIAEMKDIICECNSIIDTLSDFTEMLEYIVEEIEEGNLLYISE